MTRFSGALPLTYSVATRVETLPGFRRELKIAQERVQKTRVSVAQLTSSPSGDSREALSTRSASASLIEGDGIHIALARISPTLASSYAQVKSDLQDDHRISWAGTAHEIREVLATLLRTLAPDPEVTQQSWYKQEPNTSGPTQKQRTRYILQQHGAGSKELEVASQVSKLEEMIGDLVRATYSRASDAAHQAKTKREVVRIVKYFDTFAYDLLNLD